MNVAKAKFNGNGPSQGPSPVPGQGQKIMVGKVPTARDIAKSISSFEGFISDLTPLAQSTETMNVLEQNRQQQHQPTTILNQ